jgi:hypothetical protein
MEKNWQKRSQSAQGMVEFAMVLPILLMIILAIFAFGHFMFSYITTVSASREAARYGAAVGPSENGVPRFEDCSAIRASARRVGSIAGISTISILFDDGAAIIENCTGDRLTNPGNIGLGDRIVVEVVTNYTPIVPLVDLPSFPIRSRSTRTILRAAPVGTAEVALPVQSANKQNTTITITSDNPDYSLVGEPVDVTFSLTHTGTLAALPTGSVKIVATNKSGGTIIRTVDLSEGHVVITPDVSGEWTIKATYIGDVNYNGSLDTEPHQVYYATTVSITDVNPPFTQIGANTDVVVDYLISPTPAVTGTEKPVIIQISTEGTLICEIIEPDWTGQCTIPAYVTTGLKTITITLPAGDPNFLESTSSVTHKVMGGFPTTTTITGITNNAGSKSSFDIGDQARVRVQVTGQPEPGIEDKPVGKVRVTGQDGMTCEATVATDGSAECLVNITSRGSNGTVTFTARFLPTMPSTPIFDESVSEPVSIYVGKLKPVLTVLGHSPDPSGMGIPVNVTIQASSPVSTSLQVTGRVTVTLGGATCTATLGSDGRGTCQVTPMTAGTYPVYASYDGQSDPNFEAPASQPVVPNHTVNICPTVTYRTFFNTPDNSAAQMVVTVNNPLSSPVSILQINTNWPATVQKMYIKQLFLGVTNDNASKWACNSGNGCLFDAPGGTGVVSFEDFDNGRDYFSSYIDGGTCDQFGTEPVGVCYDWKKKETASVAAGESKDLYFVLSVNAQKTGYYNVRLRTNNQTCPWIQTEFLNNTP